MSAVAPSARVVFLTNFIAPYWKPVLVALSIRFSAMRVLISTPMEANRGWKVDWDGLDVVVQKTFTFPGRWMHPAGFQEPIYVHLPIDTIQQLKKFGVDVVISAEMGPRTLLATVYRKLHPKSKLVVWADVAESTEQGRGWIRGAVRRALGYSVDAFIVLGKSGARYMRSLGVPARRIFEISYATDCGRFSYCGAGRTEANAYRLLYVGQLIERKGLMQFLDALRKWASDNPRRAIEFSLVGEGPLRRSLETTSVPANLRVTLTGRIEYEDLAKIYAEAGIFAFASLADTWGVAVSEAMASGLPVLGSIYSQAVEELVEDGRNGWGFRPDDPADVYRAIDRSMTTPIEALNQMRENARRKATQFTPEHVAGLIEAVVAKCMSGDGTNAIS